jgi:hypothetical protein
MNKIIAICIIFMAIGFISFLKYYVRETLCKKSPIKVILKDIIISGIPVLVIALIVYIISNSKVI